MYVRTATELAGQIGLTSARISQLRKETWFPAKTEKGWHVDRVREAIARNSKISKSRKKKPKSERKTKVRAAEVSEPNPGDVNSYLATIENPDATAVEVSEASMRLAASGLADASRSGDLGARDYENLKKALEEHRRTKQSFLDVEEQEGRLIGKDVAQATGASLAGMFVRMTDVLEDRIALQFEIWLGDDEFVDMAASEREGVIRNWLSGQFQSIRSITADEVDEELKRQFKEINGRDLS